MPRLFAIAVVLVMLAGAASASEEGRASVFEGPKVVKGRCEIDRLVLSRLQELQIEPARLCSDAVFVRRAYLDVIGTLPTAAEARDFISDETPAKRSTLINRLLDRPEFADYWAMKWGDLLRVKAEFPINLWPNGVQTYHRWIRVSLRDNMPYDRFARQLLTANGSNFRVPQVNFYRAAQSRTPEGIAQTVALTFMGVRADKWEKERLAGMAGFFSKIAYKSTGEWKEEIVYFDPDKESESGGDGVGVCVFPDGTKAEIPVGTDAREVFADWLIRPENPWFTKNIANRVWSWLLGRGIIHEPDDIRQDNPASNPELLAYLERELVGAEYDIKHLFRVILNSQVYQLSSVPADDDPAAAVNFAYYPLRRLEAEVLADALCEITGTTEKYSSQIPEPFTFIPEEQRSIALADGSITSSFLELFGRPPRDTGLESERNNQITASQSLHMLNSSHVQRKIQRSVKLRRVLQGKKTARRIVDDLYLTILSRFATDEEFGVVQAYSEKTKPYQARMDLAWALVNSVEFLYRH